MFCRWNLPLFLRQYLYLFFSLCFIAKFKSIDFVLLILLVSYIIENVRMSTLQITSQPINIAESFRSISDLTTPFNKVDFSCKCQPLLRLEIYLQSFFYNEWQFAISWESNHLQLQTNGSHRTPPKTPTMQFLSSSPSPPCISNF